MKIRSWFSLQTLYGVIMKQAATSRALSLFCWVSFAESSFFPLPPDLLMVPMVLSNRKLAWKLALLGTIYSVLGGILGYGIGYTLYESIGCHIIDAYNLSDRFHVLQDRFRDWGFWLIALKGLTPIPFKLVTISSGVVKFPFLSFMGASVICRSCRFFILAALLFWFGPRFKNIIEKNLSLFLIISLVIIGVGFLLIQFI